MEWEGTSTLHRSGITRRISVGGFKVYSHCMELLICQTGIVQYRHPGFNNSTLGVEFMEGVADVVFGNYTK